MSIKTASMDWFAGASLGLLVGLLVGLSASPVASAIVGALAALLGGVFGLADKLPAGLSGAGARRLASFALATAVSLVGGILLRTHHVLSPSVQQWRAELAEIGIRDPAEQAHMLRFLRFGLLPPGALPAGKDGQAAAQAFTAQQGVLYAEGAQFCAILRTLVRNGSGPADLLSHLDTGGAAVRRAARAIQALPPGEQPGALQAAPLYLCAS